jgi:hypothetical protein
VKRSGKLIHYHGWEDPAIPPRDSIAYFERVAATMGDTSGFYRLFMAPGMLHCEGGRGPNVLTTRAAITAWVEKGTPPDRLIATKFVDDTAATPVVARTRPLCSRVHEADSFVLSARLAFAPKLKTCDSELLTYLEVRVRLKPRVCLLVGHAGMLSPDSAQRQAALEPSSPSLLIARTPPRLTY